MFASHGALAQSQDYPRPGGPFDEVRLGVLGHHVEPGGTEKGTDINFEILFSRAASAYGSHIADFLFRPRVHLGTSISVNGNTSQAYAGFTWGVPLHERLSLEVTLGGSLHNGPDSAPGSAFGCPLNFRESASLGFAVTERWRIYGTVAHMSNAGLCERNSGLTSAGVRLGYALN